MPYEEKDYFPHLNQQTKNILIAQGLARRNTIFSCQDTLYTAINLVLENGRNEYAVYIAPKMLPLLLCFCSNEDTDTDKCSASFYNFRRETNQDLLLKNITGYISFELETETLENNNYSEEAIVIVNNSDSHTIEVRKMDFSYTDQFAPPKEEYRGMNFLKTLVGF